MAGAEQPGQDPAVARDLAGRAGREGSGAAAQLPDDSVVPAHFDDAEQAARAIAPRRNVWIWVNAGLVVVVCVLAMTMGPKAAAIALAAQSALAGVVRLVVREPVAGLEVRSRWLDVTFYLGAATALVALALTAPLD
ncbi:DUF3017 domain-containing protein [Flavimobilis sp. GY10621]|uniref:DUF3017 domain-containing protein n=1 Tax=Flavimobilis rhizosphaerae TaxID=2775421 RepID=A0ABR9DP57_9MICO|nr:DUF3017 domain-containing protein [Flavimobilis rhizosphaerae]MBD9698898.1 DUF3017 domain-containing protein [Flavimobilis rhizosphaerae]